MTAMTASSQCAPPSYEVSAMRLEEYEDCIDLVSLAFTTHNPSTVHTKLSFETFRAFAVADCTRAACVESGLSLVARETTTDGKHGKVLAVMFLKVFALHQLPDKVLVHTGMQASKELYEALYEDAVLDPFFGMCIRVSRRVVGDPRRTAACSARLESVLSDKESGTPATLAVDVRRGLRMRQEHSMRAPQPGIVHHAAKHRGVA